MIPFNRPSQAEAEGTYVREVLASATWAGDGPFGRNVEKLLEERMQAHRALLVTSCTHALEMSAMLLDLQPGDEVIVPSFTFVSTVNAFILSGAKPVFADVREDTLNLDERQLPSLVTKRTRAIVPVHYAGVGCDMDRIGEIAREHRLTVIEDNAHGLFGKWRGKELGTFGQLATQSFHETKNFSCGEGGALVVNDPAFAERAEILREKGTNRARFFRGQVDKYTWVDKGSSYVLSDLQAAVLLAQLERREKIQAARRHIWETYARELSTWADKHGVRLPFVPAHAEQSFHMFYMLFPSLEQRTRFIDHMSASGVKCVFHYQALHSSPMGLRYGGGDARCPVTERAADRLVRLPMFETLSNEDLDRVISAARSAT